MYFVFDFAFSGKDPGLPAEGWPDTSCPFRCPNCTPIPIGPPDGHCPNQKLSKFTASTVGGAATCLHSSGSVLSSLWSLMRSFSLWTMSCPSFFSSFVNPSATSANCFLRLTPDGLYHDVSTGAEIASRPTLTFSLSRSICSVKFFIISGSSAIFKPL